MSETAYFKKIVLTTQISLSNGNKIPWINVGWQTGAIETSDPLTITELTKYAKEERGGVTVIDKPTFEELKKNSGKQLPRPQPVMARASLPQPSILELSPKAQSEKPSKSAAADKKVERTDKPATAKGVFPPET
jgi:hypothetical protein